MLHWPATFPWLHTEPVPSQDDSRVVAKLQNPSRICIRLPPIIVFFWLCWVTPVCSLFCWIVLYNRASCRNALSKAFCSCRCPKIAARNNADVTWTSPINFRFALSSVCMYSSSFLTCFPLAVAKGHRNADKRFLGVPHWLFLELRKTLTVLGLIPSKAFAEGLYREVGGFVFRASYMPCRLCIQIHI